MEFPQVENKKDWHIVARTRKLCKCRINGIETPVQCPYAFDTNDIRMKEPASRCSFCFGYETPGERSFRKCPQCYKLICPSCNIECGGVHDGNGAIDALKKTTEMLVGLRKAGGMSAWAETTSEKDEK